MPFIPVVLVFLADMASQLNPNLLSQTTPILQTHQHRLFRAIVDKKKLKVAASVKLS